MIGLKLFPEKKEKKIDSVFLKINKHDFFKQWLLLNFYTQYQHAEDHSFEKV